MILHRASSKYLNLLPNSLSAIILWRCLSMQRCQNEVEQSIICFAASSKWCLPVRALLKS